MRGNTIGLLVLAGYTILAVIAVSLLQRVVLLRAGGRAN